ncbi:hypothetical protein F5Y00DRAFT_239713 [Daldinia vernicosa]|uniref:uncharacterized protein n=1 Tax=Daldinia vernicosa TaxID=114800 RepID=UPI00200792F3|nr:uncharacterized protein F5Y00DRAFT_239713 [Daldinia vernicosa]KAI0848072.1 hypothetical protein F5Y00DRAFT_239713 [Daldinia vernicosa]
MGRPPAYIFIIRHGNRLDAAEKQWHLSSPTPYDPPLTYGGWLQSKTVGARIASILQEREVEDEAIAANHKPNNTTAKPKKRRYKIVIHSSPFLRCVQTSVAIAAGLASNPSLPTPKERSPSPRSSHVSPLSSPPVRSHTATPPPASLAERFVLRLDAFLGEWLSPDYFEHITPPPRSGLMLATAKAELLRPENYNEYFHFHPRHTPSSSSQLWNASSRGSHLSSSITPESDTTSGLDNLSSLKGGLPTRYRSDSTGHVNPRILHKVSSSDPTLNPGYISPIPSYALSTSEPIPSGYVAHAREACVDLDYHWDSSRDDIGWGDGGVLPEEWAEMHQRFRKGLKRLVEWYSTTRNPAEILAETSSAVSRKFPQKESDNDGLSAEDSEDVEVENVVILVSHGAGCNALIGAITQQPVLIDVGMSSITVAQRKPNFDDDTGTRIYGEPASSLEEPLLAKQASLSDMFELRLFANTEHLSAITPPGIGRSLSAAGQNGRGRNTNGFPPVLKEVGTSLYESQAPLSRSNSINASLGSMRRGSPVPAPSVRQHLPNTVSAGGMTVGSNISSVPSTRQDRIGSVGLWEPSNQGDALSEKQAETPPVPSIDRQAEATKKNEDVPTGIQEGNSQPDNVGAPISIKKTVSKTESESSHGEGHDQFDEDLTPRLWAGAGNGGLWGAPRPPGEAETIRDFTSTKRRWTVNER